MSALDQKSRGTQGLGQLDLDTLRIRAPDPLQMQRGSREYLQASF